MGSIGVEEGRGHSAIVGRGLSVSQTYPLSDGQTVDSCIFWNCKFLLKCGVDVP